MREVREDRKVVKREERGLPPVSINDARCKSNSNPSKHVIVPDLSYATPCCCSFLHSTHFLLCPTWISSLYNLNKIPRPTGSGTDLPSFYCWLLVWGSERHCISLIRIHVVK